MNKLVLSSLAAALTMAAASHVNAQLTLANPGFETPQFGDGNYQYQPDQTTTTWAFDPSSGISANNSAFTGSNDPAPEGTQVAFLQQQGTFSQTINLTIGTYTLSFEAAQRAGYGTEDFQVSLGGVVVDTFTPSGTSYETLSTTFAVATDDSYTLTFTGLNSAGGDHTVFIDNVQLVPEPSTWAMLSLGVVGLGVVTLRRRGDTASLAR